MMDVVALISTRTIDKNLEGLLRYNPQLPTGFYGDGGKIRQIMTNIIGNAVKFTEDGFVLIDIDGVQNKETIDLQISVQDTGIGISADNITRIFKPFEQVDSSSSRKYMGTGLGLAITHRFVELMGGRTEVSSETDVGSTFVVHLSLPKSRKLSTQRDTLSEFLGKTVLSVNDRPESQRILVEMCAHWGMLVLMADSNDRAMEILKDAAAKDHRIHMAFIDQHMSALDGVDLGIRMRSDPLLPDLPIILFTDAARQARAMDMSRHEFAAYLTKPTRQSEVHDAMQTTLNPPKTGA